MLCWCLASLYILCFCIHELSLVWYLNCKLYTPSFHKTPRTTGPCWLTEILSATPVRVINNNNYGYNCDFVYKHAWRSHANRSKTNHQGVWFSIASDICPWAQKDIVIVKLYQTQTIAFIPFGWQWKTQDNGKSSSTLWNGLQSLRCPTSMKGGLFHLKKIKQQEKLFQKLVWTLS